MHVLDGDGSGDGDTSNIKHQPFFSVCGNMWCPAELKYHSLHY
jgi:hypothetical protein